MFGKLIIGTTLVLLTFSPVGLKAADWRQVAEFQGTWQFTVGDDPEWSKPETSIQDWDQIQAPGNWERYYEKYNGYGWYRKSFNLKLMPKSNLVTVFLGYIDDVDEVFLNGQKIGQTGKFFPNYETGYDKERRYVIPTSLLKESGNVIAIRVYDEAGEGGIIRANRFGIYYDREEELLSLNLSGKWKFSTDDYFNINSVNFDDSDWKEISVPMTWEAQGYPNYDGEAFYRKHFSVPTSFLGREFYLVLGKIDDFDEVYLNGKFIGRVENLEAYSRFRRNNSYRLMRVYKIPKGLLKSQNVISVRVEDVYLDGGIYEGPIGLASPEAAEKILSNHRRDNEGDWNFNIWNVFHIFD
jgi:sialate O-acetylesterase